MLFFSILNKLDGNISHLAVKSTVFSLVDKEIQKSRPWCAYVYNLTEGNDGP